MFTSKDMQMQIDQEVNPKTIIVTRMNLNFNDEECFAISFTDISTY